MRNFRDEEGILMMSDNIARNIEDEQDINANEEEISKLYKEVRFTKVCTGVFGVLTVICLIARVIAL